LGMNKNLILYRLEMLVKLCDETEPKRWTPGDGSLFSTQFVSANEMVKKVREQKDLKITQKVELSAFR